MIRWFKKSQPITLVLYFLAIFLYVTLRWIDVTFGRPTWEQIFFHIQSWFLSPTTFNFGLIFQFLIVCVFLCAILAALVAYVQEKLIGIIREKIKTKNSILERAIKNAPIFLILLTVLYGFLIFDGIRFVYKKNYIDFVRKNYVPPQISAPDGEHKKNLIYIYLEGFDMAFADAKYFSEELMPNMKKIQGFQFSKFKQASGTGWTMAGIIASQCAIPIAPVIQESNQKKGSYAHLDQYLCLGDLLKQQGYKNIFIGGADLNFTDKGSFFLAHGYDEVYGEKEWKKMGKNKNEDFNALGLSDSKLFEHARMMLSDLKQSSQPFNLTLLTLNTHGGSGERDLACQIDQKDRYSLTNKVKCTDKLLTSFVSWVQKTLPRGSTQIVVHGDHTGVFVYPSMDRNDRGIYNLFIPGDESEIWKPCRDEIMHFDMAPTILNFIGFDVQDHVFGLGVNQICKSDEPASSEKRKNLLKNRESFFNTTKRFLGVYEG